MAHLLKIRYTILIVPTLRAGMPPWTLCVRL